jgi:hypothetical protein
MMGLDIETAKASNPHEGFIPNPKLRLLDQVSEVMRFKHYSQRAERTAIALPGAMKQWIRGWPRSHGQQARRPAIQQVWKPALQGSPSRTGAG